MKFEKDHISIDDFDISPNLKGNIYFKIFKIYLCINQLKNVYRKGWLKNGIDSKFCETDAEHSLGVAFLGIILAQQFAPKLNQEKLLKMAIIHELGEIEVGDVTPDEEIDYEKRKNKELEVIRNILQDFVGKNEYLELINEFEEKSSPEGAFMKEIDSLEMALQAKVYETNHKKNLNMFIESANSKIENIYLKQMLNAIKGVKRKKYNIG